MSRVIIERVLTERALEKSSAAESAAGKVTVVRRASTVDSKMARGIRPPGKVYPPECKQFSSDDCWAKRTPTD